MFVTASVQAPAAAGPSASPASKPSAPTASSSTPASAPPLSPLNSLPALRLDPGEVARAVLLTRADVLRLLALTVPSTADGSGLQRVENVSGEASAHVTRAASKSSPSTAWTLEAFSVLTPGAAAVLPAAAPSNSVDSKQTVALAHPHASPAAALTATELDPITELAGIYPNPKGAGIGHAHWFAMQQWINASSPTAAKDTACKTSK